MKFVLSRLLILLIFLSACKTTSKVNDLSGFGSEAEKIVQAMRKQESDWSKGDVDSFMESYWDSEKLSFGGKRGFRFGYDEVKANYKRAYPSAEIMGKLTFEIIDITPLSMQSAYVLGSYLLEAKDGNSKGYFTLVWNKINGEWKIVSDHTSG